MGFPGMALAWAGQDMPLPLMALVWDGGQAIAFRQWAGCLAMAWVQAEDGAMPHVPEWVEDADEDGGSAGSTF